MTYYTRVIDNIDGHQLLGYVSTAKNKQLYYGKCNGIMGGESQYIVEFDIWNNEPAWDGGTPQTIAQNATNCRLTIDIPAESRDLNPFLYARCITLSLDSEFKDISMSHREFNEIQGNASDEYGTILGVSDHATIQTKIKLKKNSVIKQLQYNFGLNFLYNYE
jgi:hypothetical protein